MLWSRFVCTDSVNVICDSAVSWDSQFKALHENIVIPAKAGIQSF